MTGGPDLVVEVLSAGSANERRDSAVGLRLYPRRGVGQSWIVDWRAQTVAVYWRHEVELRLAATLQRDDTLTSPVLPGFLLPLARHFGRGYASSPGRLIPAIGARPAPRGRRDLD